MAASPAASVLLFELVDAAVVVDPADISRADDPGKAPRRPVDADPAALGSHVEGFTFDAYNGPVGGVGDVDYLILFADSECDAAADIPSASPARRFRPLVRRRSRPRSSGCYAQPGERAAA